MNVKAATVEHHRFVVRRRGYDRAEVDAVMGQVSRSLRNYEEEIGKLEAELAHSSAGDDMIKPSPASVKRAREQLVERTGTEGHGMTSKSEEALQSARAEAEGILAATRTEIERLFENLAGETDHVLAVAERDAIARRAEAEQEAEALLAKSRQEAAQLKQEADVLAAEATVLRQHAQEEADAIVGEARAERDRLAARIPELRTALSAFEAQVHELTSDGVIDLNEIEAAGTAADSAALSAATPTASVVEEAAVEEAVPDGGIPVPDGSGTLPAARDLVDLNDYRELKATPVDEPVAEAENEDDDDAELEQPAADAPLERLGSHVATRRISTDNETIYQRRGGGLRRRIKAQGND